MIRRLPLVALAAVLSLSVASCSSSAASTSNAPDAGVSEKAKVNLQLAYDDSEQFGASLNVQYDLVPGFRITPEIDYYDAGNGGDDAFGAILRFQRSF